MTRLRLIIAGILSVPLVACLLGSAELPPQTSLRTYRLARIEVTGVRRVRASQVIGMSGLRVGQAVTAHTVNAASDRLRRSGIFSSVGHRYRQAGYDLIVIFEVTEPDWTMAVRYDNFLEWKAQELDEAIAASLPGFEGKLPETPQALARAVAAVEAVVQKRLPDGRVTTMTIEADGAIPRHYRLRLEGPGATAPVCAVEFSGVPDLVARDVDATFKAVVGQDYSAGFLHRFANANMLPAARRLGFLSARVSAVSGRRVDAATRDCADRSVVATLTMNAGPVYRWGGIEWRGMQALTGEELEQLVPLEVGATANGEALDKGLDAVRAALRRKAYLMAQLDAVPRFDDASQVASYVVSVVQGARFRMRALEIVGLEEETADRVRAAWSLKTGDFYDASYWLEFSSQIRAAERQALAGRTTITRRERIDGPALSVDIVLEFDR